MRWPTLTMPERRRSSVARCMIACRSGGMRVAAPARVAASFSSSDMGFLLSGLDPLVVGLAHCDDRVIGATILTLDIGKLVVRRRHHREEGRARGITHQRDVVPA